MYMLVTHRFGLEPHTYTCPADAAGAAVELQRLAAYRNLTIHVMFVDVTLDDDDEPTATACTTRRIVP